MNQLRIIAVFCLCFAILDIYVSGMEMPADMQKRIEETKKRMKQPSSIFDHPRMDGIVDGPDRFNGHIIPFDSQMLEAMASEGPNCRRKNTDCGAVYQPCCRSDPDTQEPLMCQYPEGSDVSVQYVTGTCVVNPNPPPASTFKFS